MATPDVVFTMGPANVTSLIATTLSTYGKSLGDNVHKAIPALAWLAIKKRVTEEGGATIVRSSTTTLVEAPKTPNVPTDSPDSE